MSDQAQTAIISIVTLIVANWVTLGPMLKHTIKFLWEKSIAWRDMENDIASMKLRIEKLEKDVTAAHVKIRADINKS